MALTYKNQITDRVQKVLEPSELADHLAGVRKRGRPIDPKRILLARKRRERLIVKMNGSWKWKRLDAEPEPEPDGDDEEETSETSEAPKAAEVRAWAKAAGVDVPARGKVPPEVVEQFKAAHSEGW